MNTLTYFLVTTLLLASVACGDDSSPGPTSGAGAQGGNGGSGGIGGASGNGSGGSGGGGSGGGGSGGGGSGSGGGGGGGASGTAGCIAGAAGCVPSDCPADCSGHGSCASAVCNCDFGYAGSACDECSPSHHRASDGSSCTQSKCDPSPCTGAGETCVESTGACCAAGCDAGSSECSSGSLRVCSASSNGCGTWSAAVSCGDAGCADALHCALALPGVTVEQWGTAMTDGAYAVTVGPDDAALVVGTVSGAIDGQPFVASGDAFVSARAVDGAQRWTRLDGSDAYDQAVGVAVDGSGNVFEAGWTSGKIGAMQLGTDTDVFLIKRLPDHSVDWITQWGTATRDVSYAMTRDKDGNLFVCGETWGDLKGTNAGAEDAFLSKIGPDGKVLWSAQWGTSDPDVAFDVSVDDAGNAYVTGVRVTYAGPPQERDVFLVKVDASGAVKWNTAWSSPVDAVGRAVLVLSTGKLLVAGSTAGDMGGSGSGGIFVSIVSAAGVVESTEQLGETYFDGAFAAVKGAGTDVYIAGTVDGSSVPGAMPNTDDAFVQKRNESGTVAWTKQFGSVGADRVESLALTADGTLYVAGFTYDSFPGYTNRGVWDAFVATVKP